MFRLVGIFLVVAIAAASYFLVFEDSVLPSADLAPLTQQQNTAPIAATEPTKAEAVIPAPLVLPKLTSSEKKQAQAHVLRSNIAVHTTRYTARRETRTVSRNQREGFESRTCILFRS